MMEQQTDSLFIKALIPCKHCSSAEFWYMNSCRVCAVCGYYEILLLIKQTENHTIMKILREVKPIYTIVKREKK